MMDFDYMKMRWHWWVGDLGTIGKIEILAVVIIVLGTVASGMLLHFELGAESGSVIRKELDHYILVFGICGILALVGNVLAGGWGRLAGVLLSCFVFAAMLPAPQADLGENISAQARLGHFHKWLEWLLIMVVVAYARYGWQKVVTDRTNAQDESTTRSDKGGE